MHGHMKVKRKKVICMPDNQGNTYTHTEHLILIVFFSRQQSLGGRVLLLRCSALSCVSDLITIC